ncbi:hypothetical protein PoB_002397800 [Plakobranchus ocellatus]|uniref:Uncharacterized protein n=1 Tax=Plakobranchus ocellatus TaxID=259542 RepID=A0AAV3ZRJ9_9GAST|nr:hypothetical protein PoB_002397800 [Plakobranchus ocellatus]
MPYWIVVDPNYWKHDEEDNSSSIDSAPTEISSSYSSDSDGGDENNHGNNNSDNKNDQEAGASDAFINFIGIHRKRWKNQSDRMGFTCENKRPVSKVTGEGEKVVKPGRPILSDNAESVRFYPAKVSQRVNNLIVALVYSCDGRSNSGYNHKKNDDGDNDSRNYDNSLDDNPERSCDDDDEDEDEDDDDEEEEEDYEEDVMITTMMIR